MVPAPKEKRTAAGAPPAPPSFAAEAAAALPQTLPPWRPGGVAMVFAVPCLVGVRVKPALAGRAPVPLVGLPLALLGALAGARPPAAVVPVREPAAQTRAAGVGEEVPGRVPAQEV